MKAIPRRYQNLATPGRTAKNAAGGKQQAPAITRQLSSQSQPPTTLERSSQSPTTRKVSHRVGGVVLAQRTDVPCSRLLGGRTTLSFAWAVDDDTADKSKGNIMKDRSAAPKAFCARESRTSETAPWGPPLADDDDDDGGALVSPAKLPDASLAGIE